MVTNFTPEELRALRAPFPLKAHTIREGHKQGGKIRWFAYIERQAVQDRLDEVFPGEWGTTQPALYFNPMQLTRDTGEVETYMAVSATVGITVRGVTRWDGGDSDGDESTKGALTNAFRRTAAYGWGIARYIYDMEFEIKTDTYSKGEWDKRKKLQDEAWGLFEKWYTHHFGANKQPEPPKPQKVEPPAHVKPVYGVTTSAEQPPVNEVKAGKWSNEDWSGFWKEALPLYDNPKHGENSIEKMFRESVIQPGKHTPAEALDIVRKHVESGKVTA